MREPGEPGGEAGRWAPCQGKDSDGNRSDATVGIPGRARVPAAMRVRVARAGVHRNRVPHAHCGSVSKPPSQRVNGVYVCDDHAAEAQSGVHATVEGVM